MEAKGYTQSEWDEAMIALQKAAAKELEKRIMSFPDSAVATKETLARWRKTNPFSKPPRKYGSPLG